MNNDGIIYEILKNKIIVLNPDGEFVFIRKKSDASIGQMVKYCKADILSYKRRFQIYVFAAAIAAVLIFAFICANSPFKTGSSDVYGFVDVDINPSVEFVFDREYRVLRTAALNDDSKKVLEGLDLEDRTVYSAICEFIDKSKELSFIKPKDENVILICAALNKDKHLDEKESEEKGLNVLLKNIDVEIKESNRNSGVYITNKTIEITPEEREMALKNSLSMGRYYLYAKAKEQGNDIKVEQLDHESIQDLLEKAGMLQDDGRTTGTEPLKPVPTVVDSPGTIPSKGVQKMETTATTGPTSKIIPTPANTKGQVYTHTILPKQTPDAKGKLKIRFYSTEKLKSTQGVHINFQVINTGTSVLDLKDVKVRYYFEKEGISGIRYAAYYYSLGSEEDIHGKCYSISGVNGADSYMEITFGEGSLQPGGEAWIEGEMLNSNWSYFDQTNDYSFNPKDTVSVDWDKMTAYVSGVLEWGIEP